MGGGSRVLYMKSQGGPRVLYAESEGAMSFVRKYNLTQLRMVAISKSNMVDILVISNTHNQI